MSAPEDSGYTGLEIAIVGMAGRFPGARSVAELWRNLRAGVESVTTFDDDELLAGGEDPARLRDPKYVRRGAVLDGIERFDAGFFGITPREAELMDPQHRLFLQEAWHALESAGCDPNRFDGAIGVYGAASSNTYLTENLLRNERVEPKSLPALFGNQGDYLTTRVSYKLDLRGPSVDVQTGCSSSLVALHLACQGLLAGECDLALAGGVSITVPHRRGYVHQEQGIYSPDGHCRAFSSRAEGTVGGNGVAIVALRRLEDALRDGDRVWAVVRGSAINNDGSDKVGYSAPSVAGQTQVVKNALAMADVDARSITYVETHGTGTALGDPIEVAALTDAFATDERGFCALGSIKTNVGHLDTAAGVTGVIKASLALAHRELPPSLHCDEPDPKIDFPSTPFFVNRELRAWERPGPEPRRAGVSSFGIGGTNAHVILEEAPSAPPAASSASPSAERSRVAVLSAKSKAALDAATDALGAHLRAHPEIELDAVVRTLATGRARFARRRAVAARTTAELARALAERPAARTADGTVDDDDRTVAFLFPGQGAQHAGMGRDLYAREPVYREHVDRACEHLRSALGRDLRELLHATGDDAAAADAELRRTALTQPALFVVEHALARLWLAHGVRPAALIGHSIGEYVAATLAGVFELEAALDLVAARGRLMQGLPPGSMLAVPLAPDALAELLPDGVTIAAINEPSSSVASGPDAAIAALAERLSERGVAGRELVTSHAFHSPMMDPILAEFEELVRAAGPRAPRIPFVSNTTGTWIRDDEARDAAYWARHLRQAVRFADGIATLASEPRVLIEVGPGTTLTTLAKRTARAADRESNLAYVTSARHPREEEDDERVFARALGQAWVAGVAVADRALGVEAGPQVELPGYAFDERTFWIEPSASAGPSRPAGKLPDLADWFSAPSWSRRPLGPTAEPARLEHVLLLADRAELAHELAARLEERGSAVTVARPGAAFAAVDDGSFELRPGERADADALCAALAERFPDAIVHAWCLDDGATPSDELARGLGTLVALGQAIAARAAGAEPTPVRLALVTRDVQAVRGDEPIVPERAAALGACTALAQEVGGLTAFAIDVDAAADAARARSLAADVERASAGAAIAYRGRHRWIRTFEPYRVEAEPRPAGLVPPPLADGGHYLIVGGLGSVGLEVAGILARDARAKLVLSTRGEFPSRADWDARLAAHPDDETARRIRELRNVEAAGGTVCVVRADPTDAASLAAAIETGTERFGPLRGVVHAAGAEKRMTLFGTTTRDDLDLQLAPKLQGLRALEQALAGRELDFCIVQSSLASVLGVLAMVGYVAAHHAVDAFCARHNQGPDTPWTSANWDHWLTWREPEFAHGDGDDALFMSRAEGAEAFRRVLALPPGTQVVVSSGDLGRRLEAWIGGAAGDDADEPAGHERPELSSDYAAPETPAERALAKAWSDVLGIARIGIHDSFFELGGDSVLGLQAVAKLAREGYRVTPAQIFEHPTIAALARAATTQAADAEQDLVQGDAPLLPIQRWFFELGLADPSYFNMPTVLELGADVERAALAAALEDVTRHHDALRLRFRGADGDPAAVEQVHAPDVEPVPLCEVDLGPLPADERPAAMRARCDELHRDFDLEAGPLQAAALFRCGSEPARLVWIAHHLTVDAISWRILAEDLQTALAARRAGRAPELPPKTTSYKAWSRALVADAGSKRTQSELEVWTPASEPRPLPRDLAPNAERDDAYGSAAFLERALDADATARLSSAAHAAYGTRDEEVLLCALARTLSRWTGSAATWVDLEGHGRDGLGDELDVSRTVGWFTTLYPVHVDLAGADEPGAALKRVKETLRRVPRQGLGYGALRYASEEGSTRAALARVPRPEVNFLWLGRAAGTADGPALMQVDAGAPCPPDAVRPHALVIVAHVVGDRLHLRWDYSTARHEPETIAELATRFETELDALLCHCTSVESSELTPSDFPAAQVKQTDLDKLLAQIGKTGPKPAEDTGS